MKMKEQALPFLHGEVKAQGLFFDVPVITNTSHMNNAGKRPVYRAK